MANYLITKPRWETEMNPSSEVKELIHAIGSVYAIGLDNAECTDFTSMDVLYAKYVRDHQYLDTHSRGKLMNRTEFGAIFRRVFSLTEQGIAAGQVRVKGTRIRGYRYCKGPGSLVVQREPGNPRSVAAWNVKKNAMYREKYGAADDAKAPTTPAVAPTSTQGNPIYRDIV